MAGRQFSPKAVHLWQDQLSEEWYNSAKHTLECTKPLTIIHTYAILRLYGDEIYQQYVDTLFDLGKAFAGMIKAHKNMELVMEPLSNIVCFRYLPEKENPDAVNQRIAAELLKDGTFYIVNTTIHGDFYLRVTLMNPMTDEECLEGLLSKIQEIYEKEHGSNSNWALDLYPTKATAEKALQEHTLYVLVDDDKACGSIILNQSQPPEYQKINWKYPAEEFFSFCL